MGGGKGGGTTVISIFVALAFSVSKKAERDCDHGRMHPRAFERNGAPRVLLLSLLLL